MSAKSEILYKKIFRCITNVGKEHFSDEVNTKCWQDYPSQHDDNLWNFLQQAERNIIEKIPIKVE